MEMALVGVRRHGRTLAPQDVGREVIIPDELAAIGFVRAVELLHVVDIDRIGFLFLGRSG